MKFSRIELQTLAEQMLSLSWLETEFKCDFSVQFGTWAMKISTLLPETAAIAYILLGCVDLYVSSLLVINISLIFW